MPMQTNKQIFGMLAADIHYRSHGGRMRYAPTFLLLNQREYTHFTHKQNIKYIPQLSISNEQV